jgi:hypothetical protein
MSDIEKFLQTIKEEYNLQTIEDAAYKMLHHHYAFSIDQIDAVEQYLIELDKQKEST